MDEQEEDQYLDKLLQDLIESCGFLISLEELLAAIEETEPPDEQLLPKP